MTVAAFRAAFPEFAAATFPDAAVSAALARARSLVAFSVEAQALAAAHLLALNREAIAVADDGGGVLLKETTGDRAAEYLPAGVTAPADAWWARTTYGRAVLALRRAAVGAVPGV